MSRGWVKLHRSIADNKFWMEESFTRGQAWVDMILLANHQPGHIRVRGNKVDIQRGQLGWSEVQLAKRWKWSRGKVRRFLGELNMEQQIVQQKDNIISVITLVNYDRLQSHGTADSTADGQQTVQQTEQQTVQQTDTNKNEKKNKNGKKGKNKYHDQFEIWWDAYPLEGYPGSSKNLTFDYYTRLIEAGASQDDLLTAAQNYRKHYENGKMVKRAQNFLSPREGIWDGFVSSKGSTPKSLKAKYTGDLNFSEACDLIRSLNGCPDYEVEDEVKPLWERFGNWEEDQPLLESLRKELAGV